MKTFLRKKASFAPLVVLGLLSALPMHATSYTTETPYSVMWLQPPAGTTMSDTRCMAVSNGKFYLLQKDATNSTIYYSDDDVASAISYYKTNGKAKGSSWSSFALGEASGYGIGSDDYGNLVVAGPNNDGVIGLPAGATTNTNKKKVTYATGQISGTANFIGVCGNVMTTQTAGDQLAGAFVHLLADGSTTLHRTQIYSNRSAYRDGPHQATLPAEATAVTGAYVRPNRDDHKQVLVHTGGSWPHIYHYSITIPPSSSSPAAVVTKLNEINSGVMSATLVGTGDKAFYIYASQAHTGWVSNGIEITIQNVNNPGNVTKHVTRTTSSPLDTQAAGMVGVWIEAEYNAAGDAIYIYIMSPGTGVWLWVAPVVEKAAIERPSNLAVNYTVHGADTDYENRVDATFTWTPSTTNRMKLQRHTGDGEENTDWTTVRAMFQGTSSCTITNIINSGEYRIVAFDSNPIDEEDGNLDFIYESDTGSRLKLDVPYLPVVPKWDGAIATQDGYGYVLLNWNNPYGPTPNGYNIFRDDELIVNNHPVSNYIDRDVTPGEHTYYIQSVYLNDDGNVHSFTPPSQSKRKNASAARVNDTSVEASVTVLANDPGLNQYRIEPVYNVRIGEDFDNNPATPYMTKAHVYRQGEYRDGYWYTYQWSDDYTLTGGTKCSIIRFDASKTTAAEFAASATTVFELEGEFNAGIGLAFDDAGNLYINKLTREGFSKERYNSYMLPMLKGYILRPKADNSGNFEIAATVDFEGNGLTFDQRTIYYQMTGNVMSAEGGYLYLSEFDSNMICRVHLVNGAIESWVKYNHTTGADHAAPTSHVETYLHPLRGTTKALHSIRGGGLYKIDFTDPTSIKSTEVLTNESTSNSVGVYNYWHNNRMFIITPNDGFPHSMGNFQVSVAGSSTDGYGIWADEPANVEYVKDKIITVATYTHTDLSNLVINNNAAGWFHCEPLGEGEGSNGFYIYQYVPGMRFAKYRLTYDYELSTQQPSFEMEMDYLTDEDSNPIDIKGINGIATWSTIKNIGQGNSVSNSYRTPLCYQIDVKDADDNVLETVYLDAAGNTADASILTNPQTSDWNTTEIPATLSHTITGLDETTFSANLTIHYINQNTAAVKSTTTQAETLAPSYEAAEVSQPSVRIINVPYTESGVKKRIFRIDFDFLPPVFSDREEPVSYYQVMVDKNKDGNWEALNDLVLVRGSKNENSGPQNVKARAAAEEESDVVEVIPGTYDFDNDRQALGLDNLNTEPAVASKYLLTECDANNEPLTDPTEWNYSIVAQYAANAVVMESLTSIAKSATTAVEVSDLGETLTGLTSVLGDVEWGLFPNPAHNRVNITSPDPIYSVEVYSLTGTLMLAVNGNLQNVMALPVSGLSSGNYIIRVNGTKVLRLIKV